jgi:hypothetical protein
VSFIALFVDYNLIYGLRFVDLGFSKCKGEGWKGKNGFSKCEGEGEK